MEKFLYDICLFRWARIGPIYLGNFLMLLLFFGGPIIFSWLNQNGYNIFEVVIWSFKYVITYIFNLIIKHIVHNYKIKNFILIIMIITLLITNTNIKFIIILILSFILINQNIEYKKENYIKEYKFGKKVYFFIYIAILVMLLFILKYSIFIKVVPVLIVIIHILYWFKSKK